MLLFFTTTWIFLDYPDGQITSIHDWWGDGFNFDVPQEYDRPSENAVSGLGDM